MLEEVILVDENDVELGRMEKMEAHLHGALHRAVSVFIFNGGGQLLLQKRAAEKYHSPGKWSNTCCTHPRPGESTLDAASRRLYEEMGMNCALVAWSCLLYRSEFENGLIEHEYVHIFVGVTNSLPVVNPLEVEAYQYVELKTLQQNIEQYPERYTTWLGLCIAKLDLKTKENENTA